MNTVYKAIVLGLGALIVPVTTVLAQDMFVYPAQGQSNDQMEQDKFQCYGFARDQSGFDPMQAPTATRPPPEERQVTSTGRSVARGATAGAAYGALTGNSSKARDKAKRGAAAGLVVGGMRNSSARRENDANRKAWEQEQQQIYAQNRNNYNRAYAACLEGRGYSVR